MSSQFFWGNFSKKKVFVINFRLWEVNFGLLGNTAQALFTTEIYVLRTYSMIVFWLRLKPIPTFGEKSFSNVLNSSFYVSKRSFGGMMFLFEKMVFLYFSEKNLDFEREKAQTLTKNFLARLSKLLFTSSEENLKESSFFKVTTF